MVVKHRSINLSLREAQHYDFQQTDFSTLTLLDVYI
jgi:hypothetical protein